MNFLEHHYDEADFLMDSASYEAAEMAREQRDMQDILLESPTKPRGTKGKLIRCCDNPAMLKLHQSLERDLDTGAFTEDYYQCEVCGSRIGVEDYLLVCSWAAEEQSSTWAPINEHTAGPIVPEVDARPIQIPPSRHSIPRKVA